VAQFSMATSGRTREAFELLYSPLAQGEGGVVVTLRRLYEEVVTRAKPRPSTREAWS
jgi:hypothetical protein